VTKRFAIGAAFGIAWGVVATGVFLAMFRSLLPAPGEAGFPLAVPLVVLYLPFVVAMALEVLVGRSAQALAEVIGVTVASGAVLGLVVSAGLAVAQKLAGSSRRQH